MRTHISPQWCNKDQAIGDHWYYSECTSSGKEMFSLLLYCKELPIKSELINIWIHCIYILNYLALWDIRTLHLWDTYSQTFLYQDKLQSSYTISSIALAIQYKLQSLYNMSQLQLTPSFVRMNVILLDFRNNAVHAHMHRRIDTTVSSKAIYNVVSITIVISAQM